MNWLREQTSHLPPNSAFPSCLYPDKKSAICSLLQVSCLPDHSLALGYPTSSVKAMRCLRAVGGRLLVLRAHSPIHRGRKSAGNSFVPTLCALGVIGLAEFFFLTCPNLLFSKHMHCWESGSVLSYSITADPVETVLTLTDQEENQNVHHPQCTTASWLGKPPFSLLDHQVYVVVLCSEASEAPIRFRAEATDCSMMHKVHELWPPTILPT